MKQSDLVGLAAVAAISLAHLPQPQVPDDLEPEFPHPPKKLRGSRDIKIKNIRARIWNKGKGKR
jgi:hypothetical protein